MAVKLSEMGFQLILSARNVSKLEELKNRLTYPERVRVFPFDLKDIEGTDDIVKSAWELFGAIDVVVLNAGLSQRSYAKETEIKVYRELMEVNYFGNISLTQALLPYFYKSNHGHFVVISSLVGKFGTPFRTGYSASKHALHGYFDSLRAELMQEKKSINVTIICPGFVATNISYNALGASGKNLESFDQANANGLSTAIFAARAIKIIQKKKYEAYIGGKEILGIYLKRFFPNLLVRIMAKAKVR